MQPRNTTNPPADMVHWLRGILDDDVFAWTIISQRYHWFEQGLVITVTDGEGQSVVLLTDGSNVFRTNCANGLPHINKVLEGLTFPESDFQDELAVRALLEDIVSLYDGYPGMTATRRYLEGIERTPLGIEPWLNGTDTDPNEFRAIWVDPLVKVSEKQWRATFNRIKPDGSVCRWIVSGRFDQADQRIEVVSIEVMRVKEKGFLFYPIVPAW